LMDILPTKSDVAFFELFATLVAFGYTDSYECLWT
jgi:hypothetical protein